MRLLFVENRYTTWLWSKVARVLAGDGHEVHWLVQNPVFDPGFGERHRLPFGAIGMGDGEARDLSDAKLDADRAVRYFGVEPGHYGAYATAIDAVLSAVQPQVVFGEPTQFHELITIALCKHRGTPFLSPNATRYPPGRISFHRGDAMDTFGGCAVDLPEPEAEALRLAVVQRRLVPSYMQYRSVSWLGARRRRLGDITRITRGWLAGERFATPAPWTKVRLDRQQRGHAARWERLAHATLPSASKLGPWALYAMQLQPESNIDVWGYPWLNQMDIICRAADSLQAMGGHLVVKPNPKSKYELSGDLCALVERHSGIIALPHASRMSDVFPPAPAVLSVTGTVLIESVLAGKPVGSLGDHAMSRYPGVTRLGEPEEIAQLVAEALCYRAAVASPAAAAALLSQFNRCSYPGTLFDPLNQPELDTADNLALIADGFRDVLLLLQRGQWDAAPAKPQTALTAERRRI